MKIKLQHIFAMKLTISLSFVLLLLCLSCAGEKNTRLGVYENITPKRGQELYLQNKFNCRVYPMPLIHFVLRNDGSYILGFCDNQITEAGQFRLSKDSILLYDRVDFRNSIIKDDEEFFFDSNSEILYYKYKLTELFPKPGHSDSKYREGIVPLKYGSQGAHYGYLRNEFMSLDSLKLYNKFWEGELQKKWIDSVELSRTR